MITIINELNKLCRKPDMHHALKTSPQKGLDRQKKQKTKDDRISGTHDQTGINITDKIKTGRSPTSKKIIWKKIRSPL